MKEKQLVEKITKKWKIQNKEMSFEEQDEIALLYMSMVLNFEDDIIKSFMNGNPSAFHKVGVRQHNRVDYISNLKGFWKKMQEMFSNMLSDDDVNFLVDRGGREAVWVFCLNCLSGPIINLLRRNADLYKG